MSDVTLEDREALVRLAEHLEKRSERLKHRKLALIVLPICLALLFAVFGIDAVNQISAMQSLTERITDRAHGLEDIHLRTLILDQRTYLMAERLLFLDVISVLFLSLLLVPVGITLGNPLYRSDTMAVLARLIRSQASDEPQPSSTASRPTDT